VAGTGTAHLRPPEEALLRAEELVQEFRVGRRGMRVHAVSGISVDVLEGETLGLVGESGCGKTTTGRAMLQVPPPVSGRVLFEGQDLTALHGEELRKLRPKLQMIFQDPISSLNPRRRVRDIIAEPLDIWGIGANKEERYDKTRQMLEVVGLDSDQSMDRRPHEFSGGQCQRISIARALITDPKVVICDEPVSALDVSVQASILNLLEDMKALYGLTLVFISHDLAVVKNISDRVAVMYLGKICEVASPDVLYAQPAHPYSHLLLEAIPEADPDAFVPTAAEVVGEPPSPLTPPSGCRFRTRCPRAQEVCATTEPELRAVAPDHFVACHFPIAPEESVTPVAVR
jgi:peptide/nickel transport system ATP-binding protein